MKKKLLIHSCCAPCIVYPLEILSMQYHCDVYFYNPNIHPIHEYKWRKEELNNFSKKRGFKTIVKEPDFHNWFIRIKGLEEEKEPGLRCWKCYEMRLEETAIYAKQNHYNTFATSLSISPHKRSEKINEIGQKLQDKHQIEFLTADFKKQGGFQKSCELSKEYNLKRQNFCGCYYSWRKNNNKN